MIGDYHLKIVNLDGYTTNPGDLSWDWLKQYGQATVYERTSPELVLERAKDADVLIVNKTILTKEILSQLPKLKYIGLQSTGYNIVDCSAAKEQGIIVSNIPEYSTNAVAQLTFSLILELTNQVALHSRSVKNGEWCSCPDFCYWKTPLSELQGKSLGIIGYGKIGQTVARIADAFDMNILAYAPTKKKKESIRNLEFVSIDEILHQCDIITLHCPLNSATENLINRDSFSKMKKTAFLINTARGPIIDELALANALNDEKISGAGLDVLVNEPCKKDNPLLQAKNCFITPHIAWAGLETRSRLLTILEENLNNFLSGTPSNVVNF